MIETPQIVQTESCRTAVIPLTVPRNEIQNVMGPGIGELLSAVAAQGIKPTGPWFSHHLRLDPQVFDFEISIPIDADVEPVGRVRPGELPAGKVARTIYHGPYEGLGSAWGEFRSWITTNGYACAPNIWEVYVVGPESSANPEDWRTELNQPLVV